MIVDPLKLRDAIIATLAAKIPGMSGPNKVATHGGDVTLDLLKRYGQDAPCLRVALTGIGATARHPSGNLILPLHVAVIVVTKDTAREGEGRIGRDAAAAALSGAVTMAAQANRWGLDGVNQPVGLQGRNEFSAAIDEIGLAAWQVTFTQPILMGESIDDSIPALSALWINGAAFDDLADPVRAAPQGPALGSVAPPPVPFEPRGNI